MSPLVSRLAVLLAGLSALCIYVPAHAADAQRSTRCGDIRQTPAGGDGLAVSPIAARDVPIAAHRGSVGTYGSGYADPDSVLSGLRTIAHCGDAIEGDWRLTGNGYFAGHHDDSLQGRTKTNCSGFVSRMRLSSIEHCKMAHGNHVMSLNWQLNSISSSTGNSCDNVGYQPELKVSMTKSKLAAFVNRLQASGELHCTLFTSNIQTNLTKLKSIDSSLLTGKIYFGDCQRPSDDVLRAQVHNVDYMMMGKCAISATYVSRLHAMGYRVSARNVNSAAALRSMLAKHVDRIVTDDLDTVMPGRNESPITLGTNRVDVTRRKSAHTLNGMTLTMEALVLTRRLNRYE